MRDIAIDSWTELQRRKFVFLDYVFLDDLM